MLNRTILLDYELIQTAYNTRTTINNDNVSYLSANGFSLVEGSLESLQSLALSSIIGVIFLRCNADLTLILNNSDAFTVNALFVNFGDINQITITNSGLESVNYRILHS